MSALNVVVVRKEELLRSVELPPPSNGLLGTVVPPDPDLDIVPAVGLDLLDEGNIRRLPSVGRPHQDAIAGPDNFVGAPDGVGVKVPLAELGLGHEAVSGLRHSGRRDVSWLRLGLPGSRGNAKDFTLNQMAVECRSGDSETLGFRNGELGRWRREEKRSLMPHEREIEKRGKVAASKYEPLFRYCSKLSKKIQDH